MAKKKDPNPVRRRPRRAARASQMDPGKRFLVKLRKTPVGQGKCWKRYGISVCHFRKLSRSSRSASEWASPPWCDGRASGLRPAKPWRNSTIWQRSKAWTVIAAVFRRALSEELGAPPPLPTPGALSIKNEDERDLVSALLEVLRQEPYAKQGEAVKRILDPIVAQHRQESEYQAAREAVRNAIVRFLKKNYPVEEAKRPSAPRPRM